LFINIKASKKSSRGCGNAPYYARRRSAHFAERKIIATQSAPAWRMCLGTFFIS
jgi:hypothetical protein